MFLNQINFTVNCAFGLILGLFFSVSGQAATTDVFEGAYVITSTESCSSQDESACTERLAAKLEFTNNFEQAFTRQNSMADKGGFLDNEWKIDTVSEEAGAYISVNGRNLVTKNGMVGLASGKEMPTLWQITRQPDSDSLYQIRSYDGCPESDKCLWGLTVNTDDNTHGAVLLKAAALWKIIPSQFRQSSETVFVGYNTKHIPDVSPTQCADFCSTESKFVCRSFDYNNLSRSCDLSEGATDGVGLLKYTGNPFSHYRRLPNPLAPLPNGWVDKVAGTEKNKKESLISGLNKMCEDAKSNPDIPAGVCDDIVQDMSKMPDIDSQAYKRSVEYMNSTESAAKRIDGSLAIYGTKVMNCFSSRTLDKDLTMDKPETSYRSVPVPILVDVPVGDEGPAFCAGLCAAGYGGACNSFSLRENIADNTKEYPFMCSVYADERVLIKSKEKELSDDYTVKKDSVLYSAANIIGHNGYPINECVVPKYNPSPLNVRAVDNLFELSKHTSRTDALHRFRLIAESQFIFFRGTNALFATEMLKNKKKYLSKFGNVPKAKTWLVGDLHFQNYGATLKSIKSQEIQYDINDFDELVVGDYQSDLIRMATSMIISPPGDKPSESIDKFIKGYVEAVLDSTITVDNAVFTRKKNPKYNPKLKSKEKEYIETETSVSMWMKTLAYNKKPFGEYMRKHLKCGSKTLKSGENIFDCKIARDRKSLPVEKGIKDVVEDWIEDEFSDLSVRHVRRRIQGKGSLLRERYWVLVRPKKFVAGELSVTDFRILDVKLQTDPTGYIDKLVANDTKRQIRSTGGDSRVKFGRAQMGFKDSGDFNDILTGFTISTRQNLKERYAGPDASLVWGRILGVHHRIGSDSLAKNRTPSNLRQHFLDIGLDKDNNRIALSNNIAAQAMEMTRINADHYAGFKSGYADLANRAFVKDLSEKNGFWKKDSLTFRGQAAKKAAKKAANDKELVSLPPLPTFRQAKVAVVEGNAPITHLVRSSERWNTAGGWCVDYNSVFARSAVLNKNGEMDWPQTHFYQSNAFNKNKSTAPVREFAICYPELKQGNPIQYGKPYIDVASTLIAGPQGYAQNLQEAIAQKYSLTMPMSDRLLSIANKKVDEATASSGYMPSCTNAKICTFYDTVQTVDIMWDNVSDSVADNIKQIPLNTRMHIDAMVGPIIETVTFFAVGKGVQYIAKQMAARSTPVGAAAEALEMPSDVNKVVVVAEKVGFVAKLSKAKQVIEASRTFKNAMKVYKVYKITNDVKKGTTVAYHASAIINAEINDDIELPMLPWDKTTAFFGAIPMPFTYGAVPNYVQQAEPKLAPGNNPYVKTGVLEDTDLSFVRSYAEVFSTAKDPLGFLQLLETGAYEGRSLLLPLENADGSQSPVIHVVTSSMHLYHRDTNSGQKFTNKVDLASHQYVLMNASSLADSIEIAKDISGSYAPDTDEDFELAVGAMAAQIAFDNLGYDEAADSFDELPFFPDFTNKLPDLSDSGVKNIPDYVF